MTSQSAPGAPITVCVPVWNGEPFVEETLEGIRSQSLSQWSALVSVDLSSDRSVEVCQAFAAMDPRFTVVVQPSRLGWIGNVNWLLQHVTSEFGCILPHDDVIEVAYLERLMAALDQHADAVLAFCDMETFGVRNAVRVGPEVQGDRFERILDFLYANISAEAFRGVFRAKVLERTGLLEETSGAAADQTWLLRVAIEGAMTRVPEILYHKRLHAASVVAGSVAAGRATDSHWADHSVACLRIALSAAEWSRAEQQAICAAVLMRAMRLTNLFSLGRTPEESLPALLALVADYASRLSGIVPAGAPIMTAADIPERLRAHIGRTLGARIERLTKTSPPQGSL